MHRPTREVTWARQRNKYHYWPLRPKISLKQNILPQQRKFQQPASPDSIKT